MKKILNNKDKISKSLFYIAYTLVVFYWMFSQLKVIAPIHSAILYAAYGMVAISAILNITRYTKKELLFAGIIFIILGISYFVSKDGRFFATAVFIFAFRGLDLKELIKYDIKIKIVFIVTIVIFHFIGLMDSYEMIRDDGTIRSSFGFNHPNNFSLYIFGLIAEIIYAYYKKIDYLYLLLLFIVSVSAMILTDSREAFVASILLILSVAAIKKFKIEKIFTKKIVKWIFLSAATVLTIGSIVLGGLYSTKNDVLVKIDDILTGRVAFAGKFLNKYEIKPFGNKVNLVSVRERQETGKKSWVLDNSYLKVLLQYGLFAFLIFIISIYIMQKNALEKKDYILFIILSIYVVLGGIGNVLIQLNSNIFLLYLAGCSVLVTRKEEDLKLDGKNKERSKKH